MKIRIKRSTIKKVKRVGNGVSNGATGTFKFVMRNIILGYRKLVNYLSGLPVKTLWIGMGSVCGVLVLILVLALALPRRNVATEVPQVASIGENTEGEDGEDLLPDDVQPGVFGASNEEEGDESEEPDYTDETVRTAENVLVEESFQTLKSGSDDFEILNIQSRLMELGYMDSDEPTTHFGPLTKDAVESFQRHNGLEENGVLDYATYSLLMSKDAKIFVMQLGDEGDAVESLQQRLYELGYITSKKNITGTFGETTEAAVKNFQSKNKLSSDGKAGEKTIERLFSDKSVGNTYKVGDRNSTIKSVKERLKKLGYYSGSVDDEFTKTLSTAIKKFQSQNDLVADGKLGPTTKDAIMAKNAPAYVMQLGDRGTDVKKVQDRLVKLNYLRSGNATSYFNTRTAEAVQAFQERNKLHADGKVGSGTYNALFSSSAKKAKSTSSSSSSSSSKPSSGSSSSSSKPSSSSSSSSSKTEQNIEKLISLAQTKLGCKYVRGAKGPSQFDCSGFVYWCLKNAGVNVSYMTSINWRSCSKFKKITSLSDCKRGDILVFSGSTMAEGHVGIYLGSGKMIDASSTQGKVRETSTVTSGSYWKNHFLMGYRIF
ncbi:MAG: peptidoglycan-binding protein [Clostridia bacterium]|nr:peptidoglycan-binding protein [Clostridia bacterium]